MQFGFWKTLRRPALVLAPMSGVTDAAFRRVIARYGRPDVTWTEFVSADGLCSPGRGRMLRDFWFSDTERPIVAQIYGANPVNFRSAAQLIAELGFDGIDINMGCPAREVEKKRAGAALIKLPQLAQEIIAAARDGGGGLPVSVKTRIGYSSNEVEQWLSALIEAEPAAITIHARTRDEMSKVPARWDVVKDAAVLARALRPDSQSRPLILGNGDVDSIAEAEIRAAQAQCDGVMIGRGIFGNPWLFNRAVNREDLTAAEILAVLVEHTRLYVEMFDRSRPLEMMKKHFKAYVSGFSGATELRARLMDARDCAEIEVVCREWVQVESAELLCRAGG